MVKEIFAWEHVFMGNLKGQRRGEAMGKIKLRIAEAACLCPEEAQSLALITVGSWEGRGVLKKSPTPPPPILLCSVMF